MSKLLAGVEAIIFDFGEVLIELDYPRVIEGFSKVANRNESEIREMVVTAPLLQAFEVGEISPSQFRSGVNELLGTNLDDTSLDEIWNAMLKRLPKERMDLLAKAGSKYRTFVLSNSNVIHEQAFNQMIVETTGKSSLHELVEKCYFSQDIGLRKPYQACYDYVVRDIGLPAEQMLFLDDRADNIAGASAVGLKTLQILDADKQLEELFGA